MLLRLYQHHLNHRFQTSVWLREKQTNKKRQTNKHTTKSTTFIMTSYENYRYFFFSFDINRNRRPIGSKMIQGYTSLLHQYVMEIQVEDSNETGNETHPFKMACAYED